MILDLKQYSEIVNLLNFSLVSSANSTNQRRRNSIWSIMYSKCTLRTLAKRIFPLEAISSVKRSIFSPVDAWIAPRVAAVRQTRFFGSDWRRCWR